ncbi:hypothetical protein PVAND_000093 [Polypedilum vanderplanki]|uniref:Thaumatin-like protein n=1 Tax=Polypedilum vanderplanki TaxID=319348 RepID=A0A9J6BJC5_POLVA|nr:hypothetical protein PVAND_000093 [Polypedilum vanderplanki]
MKSLIIFTALLSIAFGDRQFTVKNNCGFTIWADVIPNGETNIQLNSRQSRSFSRPDNWSGRIYPKRANDRAPYTLAEFTLGGYKGMDFYDISLVDGFNVPLAIHVSSSDNCRSPSCRADLNANCPAELKRVQNGLTTCESACTKFHQDQYCCQGAHGQPNTCSPSNYSRYFKQACPDAYSYAYDDPSSTFTCRADSSTRYEVVFCP